MKEKISIIGAGSWGTTLAVVLAQKGVSVELHSVFDSHNAQMELKRENREFLPGVKFPENLEVNPSLIEVLSNRVVILAVPVKFLRGVLKNIAKCLGASGKNIFVSVSKGIESATLERASQLISKELGKVTLAVLSGPNIAKEVLSGIPSTAIIACPDKNIARKLQSLFTTKTFRIYLHHDVVGVELGGALKNIIAIACGISDGLGFGTNTKAALVTRGLVEITRLGVKLGAHPATFWGASGLGDLVTTCFSPYSRNRSVGEAVGKGKKVKSVLAKMSMVAEGVETVKSAYALSKKYKVDMPITSQVYQVLHQNKLPAKAVAELLQRPLKAEKIA